MCIDPAKIECDVTFFFSNRTTLIFKATPLLCDHVLWCLLYHDLSLCCVTCSPQEVIKKLEKKVNVLIEESAQACAMGDLQTVRCFFLQHLKIVCQL